MAEPAPDLSARPPSPLDGYAADARAGDIFASAQGEVAHDWQRVADGLFQQARGDPEALQQAVDRQVEDLGLAFRVTGDEHERPWPLNPMPLLIDAREWTAIEAGLVQRADLLETVIADIYGPQTLVRDGLLPAAVISGSQHYARRMAGIAPPGGKFLTVCAFDLARGPDGEWRVLTDRVRLPVGVGYALENRIAMVRATGGLLGDVGVRRQEPFFEALRQGLAANCRRSEPRLALLTPGRFNQSYPEQAHLARHLGLSLVQGRDLAVRDGRLFVRTIAGLKRIDGLWRWISTRDIDPLNFDSRSRIGVPGLIAACENDLVLANWPGTGVVESRAMPAFLPRLARKLLDEPLLLPNVATWWCGGEQERRHVLANLDRLVLSSAFRQDVAGLKDGRTRVGAHLSPEQRAEVLTGIERRPMDYTAQEIVRLSTTPALTGGTLQPRAFTLRAFLARDGAGRWTAMPGGFVRITGSGELRTSLMGAGDYSIDAWVVEDEPVGREAPAAFTATRVRRDDGLLPAQAADNLFWMGRYGERLETTARVIRTLIAEYSGGDAATKAGTATTRLANLLRRWGAVPPESTAWQPSTLAAAALADPARPGSVRKLTGLTRDIALLLRDRLPRDTWRTINRPFPKSDDRDAEAMVEACNLIVERHAAFVRLSSDGMSHSPAWRFLDLGLAIERTSLAIQAVRTLIPGSASAEDLVALLQLFDSEGLYRSRYLAVPTISPVIDMALLDPAQPRGIGFQLARIERHLAALPPLREDGLPETALLLARSLRTRIDAHVADEVDPDLLDRLLREVEGLSEAISRSYFLQQDEPDSGAATTFLA